MGDLEEKPAAAVGESTPSQAYYSVQDADNNGAAHNPPHSEGATGIVGCSLNTSLSSTNSVRSIWSHDVCKDLYTCYNLSEPNIRGYMKRLHTLWVETRPEYSYLTAQHLRDQVAAIKKRGFTTADEEQPRVETSVTEQTENSDTQVDQELEITFNNNYANDNITNRKHCIHFRQAIPAKTIDKIQIILEKHMSTDGDLRSVNRAVYAAATSISKRPVIIEKVNKLTQRINQLKEKVTFWRVRASQIQSLMDYIYKGRPFTPKIKRIAQDIRSRHRKININILTMLKELAVDKLLSLTAAKRKLDKTIKRIEQNKLFRSKPSSLFQKKAPIDSSNLEMDNVEIFWRNLYENIAPCNTECEGMQTFRAFCQRHLIGTLTIPIVTTEDVSAAIKTKSNYSAPGPDGINNFWWKKFTVTHKYLATIFNKYLRDETTIPEWLCEGRTTLLFKKGDPKDPQNYRPITCLNTVYKILTTILLSKISDTIHPIWSDLSEQRGCKRGVAGVQENILIDSCVTKDAITYKRNLSMAWIDYRKAFDSTSHQLIIALLQTMNTHPYICKTVENLMIRWRTKIMLGKGRSATLSSSVRYLRGIYQGDSLSPLLFCITLFPLTVMLRKQAGYLAGAPNNRKHKITHLFYVDDLKLYAANEKDLQKAIGVVHRFSGDIGMEFGLQKCAVLHLKKGRAFEGEADLELVDGSAIRHLPPEQSYEYLGIPQREVNKTKQLKESLKQEYFTKLKKVWASELNAINKCKATNCLALPTLSYLFGSIKWSTDELADIDRKTRKIMTSARSHHPNASTQRLYITRDAGGRGLTSAEDLHNKITIAVAQKIFHATDPLLRLVRDHELIGKASFLFKAAERAAETYGLEIIFGRRPTRRTTNLVNLPVRELRCRVREAIQRTHFAKHTEKQMHGQYFKNISDLDLSRRLSFGFLVSPALYSETEGYIVACQDGVYASLVYQKLIFGKNNIDARCRACKRDPETLMHLLSACSKYAPNLYINRHDSALRVLYFYLRHIHSIDPCPIPPYQEKVIPSVVTNENVKIYWNFPFSTTVKITANKPDMVVLLRSSMEMFVIEMACPGEKNIIQKELEKKTKYTDLLFQLRLSYPNYRISFIPVIIGVLGGVHQTTKNNIKRLGLNSNKADWIINQMQKNVILGSLRILRSHDTNHPPP